MSKTSRKKTAKSKAKKGSKKTAAKRAKTKSAKSPVAKSKTAKSTKSPAKSAAPKIIAPIRKANTLTEGQTAPAFVLPRDGGQTVSLASFKGRKLVVFFYPRADTPGCTLEAKDFTRLAPAFASSQTALLGVSADPLAAQERFRDKHSLAIPLLSDEKLGMLKAYGAWGEKSMYGKMFMGVLRSTVLIGKDGLVARVWRGVKVDGHADEVLAAARAL